MGLLEETLRGRSLADYTNSELKIALNTALYTNTADMWSRYLVQQGYSGSVADMMAKWWNDNKVPAQFRNYINSGLYLFNPQNLFAADSPGYLYDLDDLSTVFLDSAGTTAASVNGLVGLVLDKSKGLALGDELRANGVIGLLGTATVATYNTSTGAGYVTRVDAVNQSFVQWAALSSSSFYRLDISNTGANDLGVRSGSGGSGGFIWHIVPAGQSAVVYVLATDGFITITAGPGVAVSTTFTLNSIKLAFGNHRYQGTTGSKPILRGTPTGANLASGASWTAGTGWSVAGDTATATTSSGTLTAAAIEAVVGKHYRVTYTITRTAGSIQPTLGGRTGTARSASGTYVQYFDNATSTAALVFTGTGFTGTVTLNTIEAVDISAGSVSAPYALQFEVDDFLQTAAVDFTATDKMTVCHGVRKLSDAAAGVLVELSATWNSNNGAFLILAPSGAASDYQFGSKGTTPVVVTRAGFASPNTAVLTLESNIAAPTLSTRVNAVASVTSTATQGTGNYGNYPIYFGRRAGTSLPFNGLMYSSVCIGRLLTAAELANVERWVARKTGLTL